MPDRNPTAPQHFSRMCLCQTIPKCLSSYIWLLLWKTLLHPNPALLTLDNLHCLQPILPSSASPPHPSQSFMSSADSLHLQPSCASSANPSPQPNLPILANPFTTMQSILLILKTSSSSKPPRPQTLPVPNGTSSSSTIFSDLKPFLLDQQPAHLLPANFILNNQSF